MTENYNEVNPQAPAKFDPRNDDPTTMKQGQETSSKCFVYILVWVVLVSAAALVFALVLMKPKTPDVELSMVSVNNLSYGSSTSSRRVNDQEFQFWPVQVQEHEFKFPVWRKYYSWQSGRVKSRKTKRVNVLVVARSRELLSDSQNLGSDINSGMLKLSSYAELKGEVHLVRGLGKRSVGKSGPDLIRPQRNNHEIFS